MKHYYLLLILVFSFMIPFAQTNTFPPNGNVGIGSTIPEAKLHIQSDANTSGAPSNSQMIISGITNPEKRLSLAYNTSSNYAELQSQAYYGAYTAITLNPNGGNVGIGTNSPSEKLEVNGRIKAGDRIYANSSAVNDLSLVQAYNSAGGASVLRSYSGTSYWDFSASQIAGGNSLFIGQGIDISVNNAAIAIMANKNVGIGTNDPKDSRLAVNGKIRAQEIKVEASPWPDYVFTNSYSLPTLQETERHIKEKGHLPGIPTAAKVKANGINLGEMNAKLLQKIEELTLHLIELKKQSELRDEKQNKEIAELRSKFK